MTQFAENKRIKILIAHLYGGKRGGQSAFAKSIGLSQPSVSNFIKEETTPDDRTLRIISQTNFPELGGAMVSYTWLKTGEGEMLIQPKNDSPTDEPVVLSSRELHRLWIGEMGDRKSVSDSKQKLEDALVEIAKAQAALISELAPIIKKLNLKSVEKLA